MWMCTTERKKILRVVGWLPIILFTAVIIYWYYAYVVTFCSNPPRSKYHTNMCTKALLLIYGNPSHKTRGALYLAFVHVLFVIFIWSYIKVLVTPAATTKSVPNMVMSEETDPRPLCSAGKIYVPGKFSSYCMACEYIKPDRSHHCRQCNQCILKFDHFCVWLNRCIGYTNYKFFLQTVFYGVLLGMFICITLIQQLIYDAANGSLVWNELQMLIAFWLVLGLALVSVGLLTLHLSLISSNTTTIERLKSGDQIGHHEYQNPYDLGSLEANFKACLGPKIWRWFLPINDPIFTPENAIWFPRSHQ